MHIMHQKGSARSLIIIQDSRCRVVLFSGSADYVGFVFAKALDLQGDKAPMQLRELYPVGYVFLEWPNHAESLGGFLTILCGWHLI